MPLTVNSDSGASTTGIRVSAGSNGDGPLSEVVANIHVSIAEMVRIFADNQRANREFSDKFSAIHNEIEGTTNACVSLETSQAKILSELEDLRKQSAAHHSKLTDIAKITRVPVGGTQSPESLQAFSEFLGAEVRASFGVSLEAAVTYLESQMIAGNHGLSVQVEEFAQSVHDQARRDAETIRAAAVAANARQDEDHAEIVRAIADLRDDTFANLLMLQEEIKALKETAGRGPLLRLWLEIKSWFK